MAWSIRSAESISKTLRGAFRQYLPGTDSALKNNLITVIVKVLAVLAHEFELRMGKLSKQMFLSTATDIRWVRLHASEVGIYQKPAAAASGVIEGTGAPATTYPAGIRFVSGNVTYVATEASTSSVGGALSMSVVSEVKGSVSNRDGGGLLMLADPALYPTLGTEWVVADDGLGGGADIEDIEALRARGLARKRNPPGAGTLSDFEKIATDVPGVLKAWAVRPANAPAMLVMYFLFAGRENSIPEPGDVAVVQAAIDAKRMIRVDDAVAVAPIARPIDVTIHDLESDTPDIRAAIERGIAAMYIAKCRPGTAASPFIVSRSWISEVISGVVGEERHTLVAPAGDITLTGGQFPVNGVFTYGA